MDPILIKTLQSGTLRMLKRTGAMGGADAKGCYDNIIPAVASIPCRKAGVLRSAAITNAKIMHNMESHVRTAYGVSKKRLQRCTREKNTRRRTRSREVTPFLGPISSILDENSRQNSRRTRIKLLQKQSHYKRI